ncbi:hypothetical protein TWF217_009787 [Orbilia oligospora]|nr:hypothetical protein TWF217_009787 [Orbilia oligospora]KAF3280703.1 hypothetical protein TWF132_011451 [Orbilia oligospora]
MELTTRTHMLREYLRSFLQEGNREILPLGLCNHILSFSSIETVKNFARCSKWTNDISQPHLAHTVKSRNNNLALFLPGQRLRKYRKYIRDYVNPGFAALKNDDLWHRITWDDQEFLEYPMTYTRLYALVGGTIPPAPNLEEINVNKGYQTIVGLGTLARLLCLSPKAKLLTAGQFDSGIWEDRKLNPSAKPIYMSPAHPLCYTLTALEVTMLKSDFGEAFQVIVREFPGLESFVIRVSESFFTIKQPKAVRKAWLYTQLKNLKNLKRLAIPWPCHLQSAEYKKYRRGRGYASVLTRTEEEAYIEQGEQIWYPHLRKIEQWVEKLMIKGIPLEEVRLSALKFSATYTEDRPKPILRYNVVELFSTVERYPHLPLARFGSFDWEEYEID